MDVFFSVAAGALMTANVTTDIGQGAWAEVDMHYGWMQVGIGARAVLPSKVAVGVNGFDMSEYVGLITACARVWWIYGCGVAAGGALVGYDSHHLLIGHEESWQQLIQVGGRAGADIPFGDTGLGLRLWGDFLYSSPSDAVFWDVTGARWTAPNLGIFIGAGLKVRIGEIKGLPG